MILRVLFLGLYCVFLNSSVVKSQCPCETKQLCEPVKNTTRKEVFMFSLHDIKQTWSRFDWTKVTTVIMVGYVSPQLMCFAHKHDARVVTIGSLPVNNLTNVDDRKRWISSQLKLVRDNFLDGINIDFESAIPHNKPDLKQAFTDLVNETNQAFKNVLPNYQVTVDVAWSPLDHDRCIDNRCYDYPVLSTVSDFLFVMSYDEQSQILGDCVAAANSGFYKTLTGLQGYLKYARIPPNKLVLGVPWYGYKYQCLNFDTKTKKCEIAKVPFRGVNCSDAAGKQFDFRVIIPMMEASTSKRIWDKNTLTPYFYQKNTTSGEYYEVWYDDPESLSLKYQLADKIGLRGVGVWNVDCLDYGDTPSAIKWRTKMWNMVPKYPR
ncbi:di-N-acetylchitobiase-like [Gigantopelta aegis]|uniref:di-N-acetylchitobiase-like n=1 Tax=Gigantopelta aegis TaxID=1735272 RepID=UPI001B8896A4|nr:di-N-acetylchitobiase-like [Gigantopelta aegis]